MAQSSAPAPTADAPPLASLRILLTILVLLQAVAGFLGGPHLWGIHHLAYLPMVPRLLWSLLGLALIWSPLGALLGRILANYFSPNLLGRRWVAYGPLPVIGAALFWLLRCPVHFLGDGWLLGELVARGAAFHGFDFVDYHLHARLFQLLDLQGDGDAFRLFAVISVIAGAFYLMAAAWCARVLADDDGERILLYALLVWFTPVQMFMGYVECYSLLAVFMLLFVGSLAAHYRGRLAGHWPAIAFGVALAFHLDALFLGPLLLAPIFWPPGGSRESAARRAFTVFFPILACLVVAVVFLILEGYTYKWFRMDFFDMREGQRLLVRLVGDHSLLSLAHWRDFLNLLLILAAVPLVLIAAGLGPLLRGARPREVSVFLLGALWLTLLLPFLHMKLGTARDWDLFAAQAVVYVLAAYLVWSHLSSGKMRAQQVGMIAGAAVLLAAPWFAVNAGEERSLERFRDAMAGQPRFARAYAHEEIGKYFRKQGETEAARQPELSGAELAESQARAKALTERALEEYRFCREIFPSNPRFHAVSAALQYNSGDHAAAFKTFQHVYALDSTYVLALEMLAILHAERQEWESSIYFSRKLAGDRREKARSAAIHGAVAEQLGLTREAIDAYTRAIAKDRSRLDLLERIGAMAILEGDYPRAERAFRGVLSKQPTNSALVGLAAALWEPLRQSPAARATPEGERRMREALRILETLVDKGDSSEHVLRWRGEIRAALGE